MNGIEVRFGRLGRKTVPVSITMQAVPRKGDVLLWDYHDVAASSASIPPGNYMVESVAWGMANQQYVLVLLSSL